MLPLLSSKAYKLDVFRGAWQPACNHHISVYIELQAYMAMEVSYYFKPERILKNFMVNTGAAAIDT